MVGQSARELRDGAEPWEVLPDGALIAFSPVTGSVFNPHELWVMGSQGDHPRKILQLVENEWFVAAHWSPDGQRLAYIRMRGNPEGTPQAALESCDLTGAQLTVAVSEIPVNRDADFRWLSDGRIVYSRQESAGSTDDNLWQVGVDPHSGRPTGKAKRITLRAGSELEHLRASADGKR